MQLQASVLSKTCPVQTLSLCPVDYVWRSTESDVALVPKSTQESSFKQQPGTLAISEGKGNAAADMETTLRKCTCALMSGSPRDRPLLLRGRDSIHSQTELPEMTLQGEAQKTEGGTMMDARQRNEGQRVREACAHHSCSARRRHPALKIFNTAKKHEQDEHRSPMSSVLTGEDVQDVHTNTVKTDETGLRRARLGVNWV
ncbi:hypothetical protein JOB18_016334 [Solea senegalensis]|uniref:Uncharacterized protein n=1 Tax=Solea senegalensis TaxID=28829 RepID=A0AAV6RXQ7_SOLSE|nr:hypothetical protein JOB18_016334 [Solea senegalensis]